MAQKLAFAACRLAASSIFLAAAIPKLGDTQGTLLAVYQYRILSWEASEAFARMLPWLELVVSVGLWIPPLALGASALGVSLNLIFLGALGSAVWRHLDITCGCFGSTRVADSLLPRIGEDVLLLSLFLLLTKESIRPLRIPTSSAPRISPTTPSSSC